MLRVALIIQIEAGLECPHPGITPPSVILIGPLPPDAGLQVGFLFVWRSSSPRLPLPEIAIERHDRRHPQDTSRAKWLDLRPPALCSCCLVNRRIGTRLLQNDVECPVSRPGLAISADSVELVLPPDSNRGLLRIYRSRSPGARPLLKIDGEELETRAVRADLDGNRVEVVRL